MDCHYPYTNHVPQCNSMGSAKFYTVNLDGMSDVIQLFMSFPNIHYNT